MLRIISLWVAMLLMPVTAHADIVITKSELAGPIRLVCLNPNGLISHVKNLTRNQIIGVRAAALSGEIKWPCDDVQLPVGTKVIHQRWIQTEDNWWVIGQTIQYPNGSQGVTVDPLVAAYGRQPIQFKRYYGYDGDYFVPVIPRQRDKVQKNHRRTPSGSTDMTVEQGQEWMKKHFPKK